jgi:hypothetical protein
MALNKLKFNSLNVTPTAGKTIGFNSSADGLEATLSGGAMTFISKQTASSSSDIQFTSGIDSTYKEYLFIFTSLHFSDDACNFKFNFRDGSSNFDATKTSTTFKAHHSEDGNTTSLAYIDRDVANGTGDQTVAQNIGNANDESLVGYMHLFNPSDTTFVTHFVGQTQYYETNNYTETVHFGGHCNIAAAIDGVKFDASAGTIDSGTITLYGIN